MSIQPAMVMATRDTFIDIENIIGSEFNDNLTGDDNANSLTGKDGNDTINAAGGNDFIVGGTGADNLTGGAGSDTFVYLNPGEGNDTVTDFEVGSDQIAVIGAAFSADLSTGIVDPAAFFTGGSATETAHRFGYDSGSGKVLFDPDGVGGTDVTIVATIDPGLSFSKTDITVL